MPKEKSQTNLNGKNFYQQLLVLCFPIAIQNFIGAAVGSVDVIMLNYVSQTAIAAASLASKVMFVMFIFITGISSGIAMLVSQYWGKGDYKTIERIFGISLRFSLPVATLFTLAALFFPRQIMQILTDEVPMIEQGADYLRMIAPSYLFMGFSQTYLCTARSIERVKFSTITGIVTVLINITLNACFIWGLGFFPKMGLVGVAIATSISRLIELCVCLIDSRLKHTVRLGFRHIFESNKILIHDFLRYSLPAIGNECSWGLAYTVYSVIMGRLGEDLVAANAVISVIRDLCTVVGFGIAYGGAVIIGKTIGEGKQEVARKDSGRLVGVALISSVVGGCILLLLRPIVFALVDLTEIATQYLGIMMYINAYYISGMILNTTFICGIFRAGGDSKFGFILDTFYMWLFMVPLGLLCAFQFNLPPMWVYFVLCLDEFLKMPIVIVHYKRGKWLRNITREIDA